MQVNKFKHHKECIEHRDRTNVGNSLFAYFGNCRGGGLWLKDGRRFRQKKKWHTYNGAEVAHKVEAFRGTRNSVILYYQKPKEAVTFQQDGVPEAPSPLSPSGSVERARARAARMSASR